MVCLGRTKGLMLRARTADAGNNCRPLQYPERVICRNDTNSNEIVPEDVGSRPRSLQNFRCQHSLECLRGHVSQKPFVLRTLLACRGDLQHETWGFLTFA